MVKKFNEFGKLDNFELIKSAKTPCYVIDERLLVKNLEILRSVIDRTGCRVLLAQKAYSCYHTYPLIGKYLSGTTASSLFEARLGKENMCGENCESRNETHIFSPAYPDGDFDSILGICDCIVFNSFGQWRKYREKAVRSGKKFGIRINPECSTQDHAIYDPCSPYSRLGVTLENFQSSEGLLDGISGIHFHTLCEQKTDALAKTIGAVEEKFGKYIEKMEWVNFGGGHHITHPDYDVDALVDIINQFKQKYGVTVYLEPGEAVVLNAGFLVASVLDVVSNGMDIAILDASAACHMPDVIEMPYRPEIIGAGKTGEYTYRLAGNTCLAGDIIGDYSFDNPLSEGDKLVFCDMALYTMVKNNTFNGMNLPSIVCCADNRLVTLKEFGYSDFIGRL